MRHPALLAQDLASLDVLSGGRVIAAIGAGWNRPEYDALGIPFDPVGTRVSRLTEAVAVLKGCFSGEPFSFHGEHYTVTDHTGLPAPASGDGVPLMIGGGGKRVLTLAGREADIVSLAPRTLAAQDGGTVVRSDPRSITVAATEEKLGWIREAAGDRFDAIELNVYPTGTAPVLTDDPRKGRVLLLEPLTDATLGMRGIALSPMFAELVRAQLGAQGSPRGAQLTATALIGALANLFIRWLDGTLDIDRAELTDYCVRLLVIATELAR